MTMRTRKTIFAAFLLAVPLSACLLPSGYGQSDAPNLHVGNIQASWTGSLSGTPAFAHMKGQVRVTSDDYDLYADDIKLYSAPGGKSGASGLQQAIAVGGAVPGSQVVAHIRRPLESESSEINADRAVYLPDKSRPSGGKMTFTGHVKVTTKSGFLAEPSVTTFDDGVTFLLGAGPNYPRIDSGPGHMTLTPAQ